MKKLVRPNDQRMLAGVLGGIAQYFSIDATIIRIVFVVGLIFTTFFPLALLYLAGIFIIPNERDR
ncbi:PspC domain-containing protein [Aquibacillus salsiterrae]|uniref:PspC domain-containing protein n=1 Tax=Aquibacillus salsiterrae TaxID=2950439 RepID=A0A9X4ADZ2_9BACI|nr:PspC domain-containing protein [Aquibacillus salsiterrae]MDC3416152.1 PspC domain-containing protein [Aquibacillus salsiterrae]